MTNYLITRLSGTDHGALLSEESYWPPLWERKATLNAGDTLAENVALAVLRAQNEAPGEMQFNVRIDLTPHAALPRLTPVPALGTNDHGDPVLAVGAVVRLVYPRFSVDKPLRGQVGKIVLVGTYGDGRPDGWYEVQFDSGSRMLNYTELEVVTETIPQASYRAGELVSVYHAYQQKLTCFPMRWNGHGGPYTVTAIYTRQGTKAQGTAGLAEWLLSTDKGEIGVSSHAHLILLNDQI